MKPEALHSLSVVILVAGLFLAAMGMVGTFFFGKELDRADGQQQLALLHGLTERVAVIQGEQIGLHERLAGLDQRLAATPVPATSATPSEKAFAAGSAAPSRSPSPAVAQVPPPPRIGLPTKLPSIAEGPHKPAGKPSEAKPSATKPPMPIASGPPGAVLPGTAPAKTAKPDEHAGDMAKLEMPLPKVPPKPEPPKVRPSTELSHAGAGAEKSRPVLSESQHARLIKHLRAYPQNAIVIRAEAGEAYSVEMAMALRAAFRDAGWEVATVQLDSQRAPFPGLSLSAGTYPPPKEFVAAFGALEAAGFRVASNLDPHQSNHRVILSVGTHR